jgi:hypothetical protein
MVHIEIPAPILTVQWPQGLNPTDVPFLQRTKTVLERPGLSDDPAKFNSLTVAEVAEWCNAGPVTIDNLRTAGNKAIRTHQAETGLRQWLNTDMEEAQAKQWARHIWHPDPRFTYHHQDDRVQHRYIRQRHRPALPLEPPRRPQKRRGGSGDTAPSGWPRPCVSKPSPVNKGHDSKSSSNGQDSPDTTPSPEPKQDGGSVSHLNASTNSSNNSTTDSTVPAHRPGYGCHKSERSPPWLAGRLHNRGSRCNTGGLRTTAHYLILGNQHEREGPCHIVAQGTNQVTAGVRKSGTHMRALPHTRRTGSYAPPSESRPLPRGFRRAEKPEKKSCHDDETRVMRTLT